MPYTYRIIAMAIILLGAILIMDRRNLFALRNMALLFILSVQVGIVLYPVSIIYDWIESVYADPGIGIYESRVVLYFTLGFLSTVFVVFVMDRLGKNKTGGRGGARLIASSVEKAGAVLSSSGAATPAILLAASVAGAALIFYVFYHTGVLPYCEPAEKYFISHLDSFIGVRPIYHIGTSIIPIAAALAAAMLLTKETPRRHKLLYCSILLLHIVALALTIRRGDLLKPVVFIAGGLILTNRGALKKGSAFVLLYAMAFFIAFALRPANNQLIFTEEICGKPPAIESSRSETLSIKQTKAIEAAGGIHDSIWTLTSAVGAQVRETVRVIHSFEKKEFGYFYGKTFLAPIVGAVSLTRGSAFKEKYFWGRVTARIIGLNPDSGGSPRVGIIGESYVNFGLPGVIVFCALIGLAIYYFDLAHKLILSGRYAGNVPVNSVLWYLGAGLTSGLFNDSTNTIFTWLHEIIFFLLLLSGILITRFLFNTTSRIKGEEDG